MGETLVGEEDEVTFHAYAAWVDDFESEVLEPVAVHDYDCVAGVFGDGSVLLVAFERDEEEGACVCYVRVSQVLCRVMRELVIQNS